MRHICSENIPTVTRKGHKEGQEKWVSLAGSNWISTCSKALNGSLHLGEDVLTLYIMEKA